jgi:hypothetical protein
MRQGQADSALKAAFGCHKLLCSAVVEPSRPSLELAGAGGTLIGITAACGIIGALVGWAAGSAGLGLVLGLVVGIPAGIVAVYRRYREFFT